MRPFNTYGPRQSTRAVVPTIITQALTRDKVALGNLEPRRDLTYVSDIVDGFLRAGQAPDIEGEVLNLGSGAEISVGDLAGKIIRLVGRGTRIVEHEDRKRPARSEVQRLVADSSRARERLGWKPRISLEEGLAATIRWISDNMQGYRPGNYQV